ncbi:MAG: ABC transporter permease [Bacillota bacterium]|nr:ABC transporter permease [Bacillota bacterium]
MRLYDNFKLALTALKVNKLRTFMTMLGIIIGIGSVITIVNVGDAMAINNEQMFLKWGGRNININVYEKMPEDGEFYISNASSEKISIPTIQAYKEKFGNMIEAISYNEYAGNGEYKKKNKKLYTEVVACNESFRKMDFMELLYGRDMDDKDLSRKRYVCLVNQSFVKNYFGYSNPIKALGQKIDIPIEQVYKSFEIVGICSDEMYDYPGSNMTRMLIPYTVYAHVTGRKEGVSQLVIQPKDNVDLDLLSNTTMAYWKSLYKSSPTTEVSIYSGNNAMKQQEKVFDQAKLTIGAIAAISLLVGGIGVMNIMMVSVTERTREIGIRMALGAKTREILLQFVIEAVVICLIGGFIGVIIGSVAGYLISSAMYQISAFPSLITVLVAVGFSMFVGVFFGYYPAKKASDMDPIDALRYE